MNLQVLLSAMHLKNFNYINTLNITTDCVVINQSNINETITVMDKERKIRFITTTERGLSRSRNLAINNADADICILCDNDVEYLPNYKDLILDEFKKYPEYDLIVFFVKRNLPNSKPYFDRVKKMGYYSTCKVLSPEIAFRRKSIVDKEIRFKTQFGAGSKYSMGEENIFLYECLRKGIKVLYVPLQIAKLRVEKSTWFRGYTPKYFMDRGAIFYEMSNSLSPIFILQFAFRKYKIYKKESTMKSALNYMFQGRKQYIRENKGEIDGK